MTISDIILMGPDCWMGTVAYVDVSWLGAIMSVVMILGFNRITLVLQKVALIFSKVSVFVCASA